MYLRDDLINYRQQFPKKLLQPLWLFHKKEGGGRVGGHAAGDFTVDLVSYMCCKREKRGDFESCDVCCCCCALGFFFPNCVTSLHFPDIDEKKERKCRFWPFSILHQSFLCSNRGLLIHLGGEAARPSSSTHLAPARPSDKISSIINHTNSRRAWEKNGRKVPVTRCVCCNSFPFLVFAKKKLLRASDLGKVN